MEKSQAFRSVKTAAITGMTWLFISSVFSRAIGFCGQLAMGWLLAPREFGLYALALSISIAAGALRNGGGAQILIQRGAEYANLSGPLTKYSLVFNLLAMTLLLSIAPLTPGLFGAWELTGMTICIALSFPIGTLGMIYRSKLSIDRRFGDIAKISFASTFVWQAGVIGMAIFGFGAFSFVVPLIFQAIYESIAGWFYVREMPQVSTILDAETFRSIFREGRWVMASAALLSLAVSGDYFVVGLISDKDTVGTYFFAFQLIVSITQLFNSGVETMLPTVLTSLTNDRPRLAMAFHRTLRMLLLTSIPASLAFTFLAAPLLHFLWQGKWDRAITAVQLLAACIPAWLLVSAVRALVEARGLWRIRFIMLAAYGIGGVTAAGLGAMFGSVTEIAMSVSLYYVFFALSAMFFLPRMVSISHIELMAAVYGPLFLSLSCAAASLFLVNNIPYDYSSLERDLIALFIFSSLVFIGNTIFFKSAWNEVAGTLMQSIGSRIKT